MKHTIRRSLKTVLCLTLAVSLAALFISPVSAKAKTKKAAAKSVVIVLDPGHDTTHNGCHYDSFIEENADLAIAMYCKQELETYKGVKVYMTRTTLDCPYGADPSTTAGCLSGRINYALSVGANAIVSLHNDLDSDYDPNVSGCKIIIPNAFYRPDICLAGLGLAVHPSAAYRNGAWDQQLEAVSERNGYRIPQFIGRNLSRRNTEGLLRAHQQGQNGRYTVCHSRARILHIAFRSGQPLKLTGPAPAARSCRCERYCGILRPFQVIPRYDFHGIKRSPPAVMAAGGIRYVPEYYAFAMFSTPLSSATLMVSMKYSGLPV